jgi:D-alanyl-D-alanine dipeptidase
MRTFLYIILLFFIRITAIAQTTYISKSDSSEIEKVFALLKLTNIHEIDSSIQVDLRYASTNNFLDINLYGSINKAYLQKEVAVKLAKAQQLLKDTLPDYSLIILDATRPQSIQQKMWDEIKVPANQKSKYLSNPKYGSLHNFGAAVDVSIIDEKGKLIDMATPFDSFEKLAYPFYEDKFLKSGALSQEQFNNRQLLRNIMKEAGFMPITTEWWHFNSCYRKEAKVWYPMVHSHLLADYKDDKEIIKTFEATEDLVFRVQIYTSGKAKKLEWKKFKNQADYRYFHKGLYKYTSGAFNNLKEAHLYKNKMRRIGFKGSFVVPFYKDKRISIKDASELMQ